MINGGSKQYCCTRGEALSLSYLNVGAAASLAAPQEDADRIGVKNYILCDSGTHSLTGLCMPREPLKDLLHFFWVIFSLPSKSLKDSARGFLEGVPSRYGALAEVLTDKGREFMGEF